MHLPVLTPPGLTASDERIAHSTRRARADSGVVPWPAVCADAAGVPLAGVLAPEVVAALRAGAVLVVLALAPPARHQRVAPVPGRARAHLSS